MIYHGVAVSARDSAIVSLERTRDWAVCVAVERPGELEHLVERVHVVRGGLGHLDRIVIDAGGGLGGALVKVLGQPGRDRHYVLELSQGRARQAICDSLIAAVTSASLTFSRGLRDEGAVRKALGTFNREIGEDGALGSVLATALAVALHAPFRLPPRVW